MPLVNFTEADLRLWREGLKFFRDLKKNRGISSVEEDNFADILLPQAPEVYIAKPTATIPALTEGTGGNPDKPGSGQADIYRIRVNTATGEPELKKVTQIYSKTIFNLTDSDIDTSYISINRDKYGSWIFSPAGGSGGTQVIRGEIVSVDCTATPISAVGIVLSRPCGISAVTGEDESEQVTVYDRLGCMLTEPEADLIGRRFYATYLDSGYLGTGTVDAGTGSTDQPCQWEIISLCCGDDACD